MILRDPIDPPHVTILSGWEYFPPGTGDAVRCEGSLRGAGHTRAWGYYHRGRDVFLCPHCFEVLYPALYDRFEGDR